MSGEVVYDWHGKRGVRCPTCQKWYPLVSTAPYPRSRGCDHCRGTVMYPPETVGLPRRQA